MGSKLDLAPIKDLESKATPIGWLRDGRDGVAVHLSQGDFESLLDIENYATPLIPRFKIREDADLTCMLRNSAPAMIAEIEQLRAAALREAILWDGWHDDGKSQAVWLKQANDALEE